jgi:outer membrane protein OmpA-like peptidoglycan-associated protein
MRLQRTCLGLGLALLVGGAALAQDIDIQAELTAPLGTDISRKGDAVSARVITPLALQGDIVEGKVKESKSGNKLTGQSVLRFSFDTLRHGDQAVPIAADVKSLVNSKGQTDVDEEGRVVRRSSNLAKAAAGTGFGALVGGLAGGGKGAAIGALGGATVSLVVIDVAAQGPTVRFAAGSKVMLSAKSRGGPALASLAPNAAPATASAPPPVSAAVAASPAPPLTSQTAASVSSPQAPQPAGGAASVASQPDLTAVKANFVPGERTIFYDDFTDMAGDEAPPHWKVRGGSVTLMVAPGIRQLTTSQSLELTPNFKDFPKNFTLESVVMFQNPVDFRNAWQFRTKDGQDSLRIWVQTENGDASVHVRVNGTGEELASTNTPADLNQPVSENVWIQNGRLQVYINENRVVDANQIDLPELGSVTLQTEAAISGSFGIRLLRFAESTPDFSQVISSSGRYVTHGILFDTDSDRLKSESAAVIKSIARGLETNPNLKLQIEGHTDSSGAADHNLDLSKRRAEAVKAVLVSQFKVDAARLTTAGLGATKPIDSNDTPQGRAQNRRVEFVKQ